MLFEVLTGSALFVVKLNNEAEPPPMALLRTMGAVLGAPAADDLTRLRRSGSNTPFPTPTHPPTIEQVKNSNYFFELIFVSNFSTRIFFFKRLGFVPVDAADLIRRCLVYRPDHR